LNLQIRLDPCERSLVRFLWRDLDQNQEPVVYEFERVVFGANSSPFLVQFVTQENARRHQKQLPLAAASVIHATCVQPHGCQGERVARSVLSSGTSTCSKFRFVAAKTRVTPLSAVSIPRLELMAALLGVKLGKAVAEIFELSIREMTFRSDSANLLRCSDLTRLQLTLAWVKRFSTKLQAEIGKSRIRRTQKELMSCLRYRMSGCSARCGHSRTWLLTTEVRSSRFKDEADVDKNVDKSRSTRDGAQFGHWLMAQCSVSDDGQTRSPEDKSIQITGATS
jgi:hypothetical protein